MTLWPPAAYPPDKTTPILNGCFSSFETLGYYYKINFINLNPFFANSGKILINPSSIYIILSNYNYNDSSF